MEGLLGEARPGWNVRIPATEKMPVLVEDVGSTVARRLRFYPATGKVRVLHLPITANRSIAAREASLASRIKVGTERGGDIELF